MLTDTSESDGESAEGSAEFVDCVTPSMMQSAKLHLEAAAVPARMFTPPNGRDMISGCNE